jgi:hypothetical protein
MPPTKRRGSVVARNQRLRKRWNRRGLDGTHECRQASQHCSLLLNALIDIKPLLSDQPTPEFVYDTSAGKHLARRFE